MSPTTETLQNFLVLADQGPAQRVALAGELADFLVHWPEDCPESLRRPVTALFDMTLAEADNGLLQYLAARLIPLPPDLPLTTLARIFAPATAEVKTEILSRAQHAPVVAPPQVIFRPDQLITAARDGVGDFSPDLARWLQISPQLSAQILGDESAMSLAVLCKGALLGKARFSALSLILFQDLPLDPARLEVFDSVPAGAAMRLVGAWQAGRAGRACAETLSEDGEGASRKTG